MEKVQLQNKGVTYESSLHLIKHHPFKDERRVGIRGVFVLQPPAFLPEQSKVHNKPRGSATEPFGPHWTHVPPEILLS